MLFAEAIPGIIDGILHKSYRHILIVDRAPIFDTNQCDDLKAQCLKTGYNVIMCNGSDADDITIEQCKTKSIVAMMMKTKEIIIHIVDGPVKPFPKHFKMPSNRILVTILHTQLKKIPYTKKMFDYIINVNDDSFENVHVKMARTLICGSTDVDVDMDIHDLHMIVLILYQNLVKVKNIDMPSVLLKLIHCELVDDDDAAMSSIMQCRVMLRAYGGQAPKKMDFTQHFSNYSLLSANKRKIIENLCAN